MIGAVLVLVPLLAAFATLMWFVLGCLRDMPRSVGDEQCEQGCHPPMLIASYGNSAEWCCGSCGTRWTVRVDMRKSRREYRQWTPG